MARLAVRHGFSDPSLFSAAAAGDGQLPMRAARGTRLDVIARVSDEAALRSRSMTQGGPDGSWMLMGEAVDHRRNRAFGADFGRVCPRCLAEDAGARAGPQGCRPFRRTFWDLSVISCCHRHRVALLRECPACGERLAAGGIRPDACACGADLKVAETLPVALADLLGEAYVLGRIGAAPRRTHAMLDGIALGLAAQSMLRVGAAACALADSHLPALAGPLQRAMAMSAGMRVLGQDRGAFNVVLDGMAAAVPRNQRSPQRVYGGLQLWLRTAGEPYEWLREELRAHAAAHTLTKARTKVLGTAPLPGE